MNESVRRVLAVLKVSLLRLWNSRQEVLLIFVVPVLFFSIFALIFSRGVGFKPKQVRVSIVNDDDSQLSLRVVQRLQQRDQLSQVTGVGRTEADWPAERLSRTLISRMNAEVVVYFPRGYADSLQTNDPASVQILSEGTNPVSSDVVEAILAQAIALEQATLKQSAINQSAIAYSVANSQTGSQRTIALESPSANGGTRSMASQLLTAQPDFIVQPVSGSNSLPQPTSRTQSHSNTDVQVNESLSSSTENLFLFDKQNVFASNKHQPKVAMYAAGIAVMFLLFSASGAGASLLEEKEAGTLGRLMSSKLSVGELLAGKWLYIWFLGLMQITVMFVWGQLVFQVDLLGHLPGFVLMAVATAAATASFALFLASVCRTRNQLNGISMVVVLGMSAIGGSMIPRYIMSESMQRLGKFTFNGWALDGFKKVFWFDLPITAIRTELLVLFSIAVLFALAANLLVRNWRIA